MIKPPLLIHGMQAGLVQAPRYFLISMVALDSVSTLLAAIALGDDRTRPTEMVIRQHQPFPPHSQAFFHSSSSSYYPYSPPFSQVPYRIPPDPVSASTPPRPRTLCTVQHLG
jgi:hypothetical protein